MKKILLLGAMVCALGMMTAEAQTNDTLIAGFVIRTATDCVEYWNTKFPNHQPKRNITLITPIVPSLLPDIINGLPVRVFPGHRRHRHRHQLPRLQVVASAAPTSPLHPLTWRPAIAPQGADCMFICVSLKFFGRITRSAIYYCPSALRLAIETDILSEKKMLSEETYPEFVEWRWAENPDKLLFFECTSTPLQHLLMFDTSTGYVYHYISEFGE